MAIAEEGDVARATAGACACAARASRARCTAGTQSGDPPRRSIDPSPDTHRSGERLCRIHGEIVRQLDELIASTSAAVPPLQIRAQLEQHDACGGDHAIVAGGVPSTSVEIAARRRARRCCSTGASTWHWFMTDHDALRSVVVDNKQAYERVVPVVMGPRTNSCRWRISSAKLLIVELDHRHDDARPVAEASRPDAGPDQPTLNNWLIAIAASAGVGVTPA